MAAGVVTTWAMASNAESQYEGLGPGLSQDKYDAPYNAWSNAAVMNYVFYSIFGAAYVWNVLDAATHFHPANETLGQTLPKIRVTLLSDGIKADYNVFSF